MIDFREEDNGLICVFSGRLDTPHCMELQKKVEDRSHAWDGPVVFDLTGVDYVASLFLALCMTVAKAKGAESFTIVNVSPHVKRVFKVAGFDTILNISG